MANSKELSNRLEEVLLSGKWCYYSRILPIVKVGLLICSIIFFLTNHLQSQVTLEHPKLQMEHTLFETSQLSFPAIKEKSEIKIPTNPKVAFALPKNKHNPFFCDLEDKMYKANGVMFKFRLGSVQYVDALEGKSYYQAVPNSQTTARQLAVKRQ